MPAPILAPCKVVLNCMPLCVCQVKRLPGGGGLCPSQSLLCPCMQIPSSSSASWRSWPPDASMSNANCPSATAVASRRLACVAAPGAASLPTARERQNVCWLHSRERNTQCQLVQEPTRQRMLSTSCGTACCAAFTSSMPRPTRTATLLVAGRSASGSTGGCIESCARLQQGSAEPAAPTDCTVDLSACLATFCIHGSDDT